MSEEIKTEETVKEETTAPETSKKWYSRILTTLIGLIVGAAAMFGVNQTQITTLKNDVTKAYTDVKTTVEAIKNKDYASAIEAGKNAATTLKTIVGEVKEVTEVVKDTGAEYKDAVLELKTAIDAKDYKKATTLGTALLAKITEKVPEESLTGTPKEIYSIVKQIINDINENKYDPVIELATKLANLFAKAPATAAEQPATPAAPATTEVGK